MSVEYTSERMSSELCGAGFAEAPDAMWVRTSTDEYGESCFALKVHAPKNAGTPCWCSDTLLAWLLTEARVESVRMDVRAVRIDGAFRSMYSAVAYSLSGSRRPYFPNIPDALGLCVLTALEGQTPRPPYPDAKFLP
jgi:hypothetical protein